MSENVLFHISRWSAVRRAGFGSLSELVSGLPEEFPAPIVAVQRLDPNRESILERRNALPFRTLKEQTTLPLDPDVVFLAPVTGT